jgi:hypothetical protein
MVYLSQLRASILNKDTSLFSKDLLFVVLHVLNLTYYFFQVKKKFIQFIFDLIGGIKPFLGY